MAEVSSREACLNLLCVSSPLTSIAASERVNCMENFTPFAALKTDLSLSIQDFPLSLRQLVPLLEALGEANEHLEKAAVFMQHWSEQELFPVKVQVGIFVAALQSKHWGAEMYQ